MSEPTEREIRLRCIEAAARNPDPRHGGGFGPAVLEVAKFWAAWVQSPNGTLADKARETLGPPKR